MLRTEIDSQPAELDQVSRRVMRLEIEEATLAKEDDPASRARLEELRRELATCAAKPIPCAPSGRPSGKSSTGSRACGRTGTGAPGSRSRRAGLRPQQGRGAAPRPSTANRAAPGRRGAATHQEAGRPAIAARGRHRGRDRLHRRALDRHPGCLRANGKAAAAGRDPARTGRRPRRSRATGRRRGDPGPRVKDPRRAICSPCFP
jgi:hypothetical protein